jgi:hypothetical protein
MNNIIRMPQNGDYRYACECGATLDEKGVINHTLDGHEGIFEVFVSPRWRKSGVKWGNYDE